MKWTCPLLILVFCLLAVSAAPGVRAGEAEKTTEQWIDQLRSDDFDQRQIAAREIEKAGDAARAALERACKDPDAEVRAAATVLIAKLSRATLRLRVFDISGKPLSNVQGSILIGSLDSPDQSWQQHEQPLQLNADGQTDIKLGAAGLARYQLKFAGYLNNENTWSAIENHSGVNLQMHVLRKGGSIAGKVLDEAGKPVKDASVSLYNDVRFDPDFVEMQLLFAAQMANGPIFINGAFNAVKNADGSGVATAGDGGHWQLDGIAEGVYTCVAQAPGHYPAISGAIRVREGMATSVPNIVMKERNAGKLVVTLKKPDGTPLAKETVTIVLTPIFSEADAARNRRVPAALLKMPMHSDNKDTDEKGNVETDDLSPGKYKLTISAEGKGDVEAGVLLQKEIEIKPGGTVSLDQKDPPKPVETQKGSIRGRILSEGKNGAKGVKSVQIRIAPEADVIDLLTTGQNQPMLFPNARNASVIEVNTDAKGVYRFENLAPGKYALEFNPVDEISTGPHGYVLGVEVKAGEKTLAPETVFKQDDVAKSTEIKGRLLLPNGVPAANAQLTYYRQSSNVNSQVQNDGSFQINAGHAHAAEDGAGKEFIIARFERCKPLLIEAPFKTDGEYRLTAQDYGTVRVTVTDEKGAPLPGVKVGMLTDGNSLPQGQGIQGVFTDAKGVARLSGIGTGARDVVAAATGYFLPSKSQPVEVMADKEAEVRIMLRAGMRVEGRLVMPKGRALTIVVATLDDYHLEPVGPNGEFAFTGVGPGEHCLSANAPGFAVKKNVVFKLPNDLTKIADAIPKNAVIELAERGGIAIDCGKEFAGCAALLEPIDQIDLSRNNVWLINNASGYVDGDGRAEFWDIAPGQYQLNVLEPNSVFDMSNSPVVKMVAAPCDGPFEVKPVASPADLATLRAVPAHLKRGTGSVRGSIRLILPADAHNALLEATIGLKLRGKTAAMEADLSDPIDVFRKPASVPLIVGKPPENFKPHVPGTFEITALPPGDYKLGISVQSNDEDAIYEPNRDTPVARVVSFTIKEGEALNLGELKVDGAESLKLSKTADTMKSLMRPEDKPQDFQP